MRGNLPGPEGLARRGASAALHGLSIVSTMDRAARLASAPSPCQRGSRGRLRQAPGQRAPGVAILAAVVACPRDMMAKARPPSPSTFQDLIFALQKYWSEQGCIILQPYDMEMGAGTFHTATFLRAVGPEPWSAAYV